MKKISIILLLLLLGTFKIYAQMEKVGESKFFYDIEITKLSKKTLDSLLKKFAGKQIQGVDEDFDVFLLDNGKVIYNTPNFPMLFNSMDDLNKYIKLSLEIDKREVAPKIALDKSFIDNIEQYLDSFREISGIDLNFENLENLKKVDDYFNTEYKKGRKNILSNEILVAIVGSFIKEQVPESDWINLDVNNKTSIPSIMDKNVNLYNPMRIVDRELNFYLEKENEIALFDNVEIELIQYKAIKRMKE